MVVKHSLPPCHIQNTLYTYSYMVLFSKREGGGRGRSRLVLLFHLLLLLLFLLLFLLLPPPSLPPSSSSVSSSSSSSSCFFKIGQTSITEECNTIPANQEQKCKGLFVMCGDPASAKQLAHSANCCLNSWSEQRHKDSVPEATAEE